MKCKKCLQELDISNFSKNKRSKNGLCVWCKNCSKEYHEQYRKDNN